MTIFRVQDGSNVFPISQAMGKKERAGYEKLAVLETPDADLIAARDRADQEWEAFLLKKIPPTEAEVKQKVARHVDEAKSSLLAAGQLCSEHDLKPVHARVAQLALEVDELLSDLANLGGAA